MLVSPYLHLVDLRIGVLVLHRLCAAAPERVPVPLVRGLRHLGVEVLPAVHPFALAVGSSVGCDVVDHPGALLVGGDPSRGLDRLVNRFGIDPVEPTAARRQRCDAVLVLPTPRLALLAVLSASPTHDLGSQ